MRRSGLANLREAVASYFDYYAVPAVVAPVGLRYRNFILNADPRGANRVVFIPGEFDGSNAPKARKYGALSKGSRNHASVENPRELAAWERPVTVSCWSAPVPGNTADESATIDAAEDLLEQVVRAIHYSGMADIKWGAVQINTASSETAFGVELLLSLVQSGPLLDVTLETVQPMPALAGRG